MFQTILISYIAIMITVLALLRVREWVEKL